MIKPAIGSYYWGEATKGELNSKEKFQFLKMLFKSQIKNNLEELAYKIGVSVHKLSKVNLEQISIPDSKICVNATEMAKEKYTPALLNHCYRTFLFGSLLGQVEGFKGTDTELLFTGSILHDLGLTDGHNQNICNCCFTIEGAKTAKVFASEYGWEEQKLKALYTVISAHLNPVIDPKVFGKESALLGGGALMDVLGNRYHTIPLAALENIHKQYPRTHFKKEIIETIENLPHGDNSRAGFLKRLGFAKFAAKNPLDRIFAPIKS